MTAALRDDPTDRFTWDEVLVKGFMPSFGTEGLKNLHAAVAADDKRLQQGATTTPPPLMCVQDWPVESACLVSFVGWQGGDGLDTVGLVEKFFARACYEADLHLGVPGACKKFLNWFDDTPRPEALAAVRVVIERALRERGITVPEL